jgi:hypothetical protein
MKTVYKYIRFVKDETEPYYVCNNKNTGVLLGWVEWEHHWQQWVFATTTGTIFSVACLQDIIHFISQLKPLK